jgi:hypothetical protein
MQIAARWVGWGGLAVGAVGAIAALCVTQRAPTTPASPPDLWYRGYVLGSADCSTTAADAWARGEEALAGCMDAWEGGLAVRSDRREPGLRLVLVEESSPLDRCLQVRKYENARFCDGSWARPPADARLNIPAHLGSKRVHTFDEYGWQRAWEAEAWAAGEIVSLSCPAHDASTFVGVPSLQLRIALSKCRGTSSEGLLRLAFDEAGDVDRVIAEPSLLPHVPCVMANACGLRFAGLGAGLGL